MSCKDSNCASVTDCLKKPKKGWSDHFQGCRAAPKATGSSKYHLRGCASQPCTEPTCARCCWPSYQHSKYIVSGLMLQIMPAALLGRERLSLSPNKFPVNPGQVSTSPHIIVYKVTSIVPSLHQPTGLLVQVARVLALKCLTKFVRICNAVTEELFEMGFPQQLLQEMLHLIEKVFVHVSLHPASNVLLSHN